MVDSPSPSLADESLREAYAAFLAARPEFEATRVIDEVRAREFGRLDALAHVYLDYTGGGLYAESQVRRHSEMLLGARVRQPALDNPTSPRELAAGRERCRRHVLEFFRADPGRVRGRLHGQRQPGAEAGRRVVPVRARRPLPADLRQPQLGERHPRVRPRAAAPTSTYVPDAAARPARGRGRCSSALSTRPRRRATTSSPTRRSRTSPASSTRSSGSPRAQARGWDVLLDAAAFVADQPARPRSLAAGLRAALLLQDVRLPDRRRRACSRAARRSRSCAGPGSPAARSRSPRSRATGTTWRPAPPASRTARVDYLEHPRRRASASSYLESVGIDADPRARAAADRLAARGAAGAPARQRPPAGAALRPGGHRSDAAPPSRSTSTTRAAGPYRPSHASRRLAGRARHLAAHRLLLQPRRRRGRARPHARRDRALLRRWRQAHDLRRLPALHRPARRRGGAGLARARSATSPTSGPSASTRGICWKPPDACSNPRHGGRGAD